MTVEDCGVPIKKGTTGSTKMRKSAKFTLLFARDVFCGGLNRNACNVVVAACEGPEMWRESGWERKISGRISKKTCFSSTIKESLSRERWPSSSSSSVLHSFSFQVFLPVPTTS